MTALAISESRSAACSAKHSTVAHKAAIRRIARHGRSLNKMMKKKMTEAGGILLVGAVLNLPIWLYIAGVL